MNEIMYTGKVLNIMHNTCKVFMNGLYTNNTKHRYYDHKDFKINDIDQLFPKSKPEPFFPWPTTMYS
jgi:hypothetical protein